ncbi:MAG: alpha/beta hydrolase [Candidatus Kariarchaeaceae archaeon]|jgi:pimeloyl-ACP methyl ester carboxylesterase
MVVPNLNVVSKSPETVTGSHPLVFVHGMFQGSWVWEEHFFDYFVSQGYECHLVNLRGHNGSDNDGSFRFISIKHYVEDLKSVVDTLEDPILIGHSMGGFIIQKYLENNSAKLGIMIASVPPRAGVFGATLKVMLRHPLLFLWGNLTMSLQPLVNKRELLMGLMFDPSLPRELADRYYPRHQNESFRAYLDMLLFRWVKVKKIMTPLEFLGFENDLSISAKSVERSARTFGKEARIFPNRGHSPMIEPGWEEVAEYILSFLP